ncbi:MAG: alpha/beta fold hydrolase [Gemmatimonadota bacterium]|nr:alpha/beta fold hydrolase [Gemmatimonadota bacterium]
MPLAEIDLTVYPDECDAFGHLNQASFLTLFERARWEMLARGPGMDVFSRNGVWPAVRKTTIDYQAAAFPGDVLRFDHALTHLGRTSFTMRQTARRQRDDTLIATAEFVFVCIDREGKPVPVPEEVGRFMTARAVGDVDVRRMTVNGVSLAVDVRGDATMPALLLVHGFPLDRTMWAPLLDALDGTFRIAPDLRGFGRSDAPDLGYSMATYADDLVALLDSLGVDRAVICGLSMGGYIAFELARRSRERLLGLVLMDTRADADSPEARRNRDATAQQARERGPAPIADAMMGRLLSERTPRVLAERVRAMIMHTPVAGLTGALGAMRDRADSTPLLGELDGIRTLVVVGEDDSITPPAVAREMAAGIPGARLEVISGAAHLPPLEQPRTTAKLIAEFVTQVAAAR